MCPSVSDLHHLVWPPLGPSMPLHTAWFHPFLWLSNIPWYMCALSFFFSPPSTFPGLCFSPSLAKITHSYVFHHHFSPSNFQSRAWKFQWKLNLALSVPRQRECPVWTDTWEEWTSIPTHPSQPHPSNCLAIPALASSLGHASGQGLLLVLGRCRYLLSLAPSSNFDPNKMFPLSSQSIFFFS